jgi:hypothetical protein
MLLGPRGASELIAGKRYPLSGSDGTRTRGLRRDRPWVQAHFGLIKP